MDLNDFRRRFQKKNVVYYPTAVNSNPLVSVCVQTYQQVHYIRQCLDGILMQKTSFAVEILLGEDDSDDGTRQICIDYANKYPNKIRLFLHHRENNITVNGRHTGRFNFLHNLLSANGKYVAICEGDDFWTDEFKLQKQVDFLESHSNISGCFHDVQAVDGSGRVLRENYYESPQKIYNQRDSVTRFGGRYATCSILFRSKDLTDLPEWFVQASSDYAIDLLITEYGDIAHISENMAAYRIHEGGLWQGSKPYKNLELTIQRYKILLQEPKFRHTFGDHFREKISELSRTVSTAYKNHNNWSEQIKHAWDYFYYGRDKKLQKLYFVLSSMIHLPLKSAKSRIARLLVSFLEVPIIKRLILRKLSDWASSDAQMRAILLSRLRTEIVHDLFRYPSTINDGLLHIQRAIEVLRNSSPSDQLIIDIGSAAGDTCMIFSQAFPSCRILGFEPIDESFEKLKEKTKYNYNINVYNVALGDYEGTAEINLTNRITASSLLTPDEEKGFNGNKYFKILEKKTVSVNKLDNYVTQDDRVAIIKIDVQGFELQVLKGATDTLKRTSFILLEMQNHNIYNNAPLYYHLDDFLRSSGFELFEIIPSIRENMQIKEFDALYINRLSI